MSEEVKQNEAQDNEERVTVTGECRYCHQKVFLMMPKSATAEEIQTAADMSCKCQEGEAARMRAYNANTAYAWIKERYGEESYVSTLLYNMVDAVIDMGIDQGSIKHADMVDVFTTKVTTISMKRNADGQLIIQQQTSFKRKDKF